MSAVTGARRRSPPAVGLLLLAVVVSGCGGGRPAPPPAPERIPVSWVRVEAARLPSSLVEVVDGRVPLSRVKEVQAILRDLGAQTTTSGLVVTLPERVLFDFDRADLRPDAQVVLAKIARVLAHYERAPVQVLGHTDSRGAPEYNRSLSERRAAAVRDALVGRHRISAGRLTIRGLGETRPVAPNTRPDGTDDPEGRRRNRRVEVVIDT